MSSLVSFFYCMDILGDILILDITYLKDHMIYA